MECVSSFVHLEVALWGLEEKAFIHFVVAQKGDVYRLYDAKRFNTSGRLEGCHAIELLETGKMS